MRTTVGVFMTVLVLLASPAISSAQAAREDALDVLSNVVSLEIQALDLWWTPMFLEGGWQEPMVSYVLVQDGESYSSACTDEEGRALTITGDTDNAFYCPVDRTLVNGVMQDGAIWLPVGPLLDFLLGNVWERGAVTHPTYVPIAIVAHEFSHHVVDEFYRQSLGTSNSLTEPTVPNKELIADCLAGAFMQQFALVETPPTYDDISGIIDGLRLIADPEEGVGTHGTADQRTEAFAAGFYAPANPAGVCIDAYWPEFGGRDG